MSTSLVSHRLLVMLRPVITSAADAGTGQSVNGTARTKRRPDACQYAPARAVSAARCRGTRPLLRAIQHSAGEDRDALLGILIRPPLSPAPSGGAARHCSQQPRRGRTETPTAATSRLAATRSARGDNRDQDGSLTRPTGSVRRLMQLRFGNAITGCRQ